MNQTFEVGQHVRVIAINSDYLGEHGYNIGDIVEIVHQVDVRSYKTKYVDGRKEIWNCYLHPSEIEAVEVDEDDDLLDDEDADLDFDEDESKIDVAHLIEEETKMTNGKLNMGDRVPVAVIVNGAFKGIVDHTEDIEMMLEEINEAPEEWLCENVQIFPVLSSEPLDVSITVENDFDVTFDEDFDDEEFIIKNGYHVVESFTDEDELHNYIREGLNNGDFDEDEVDGWDISRVLTERITADIEKEDTDVTVAGAFRYVRDYVQEPSVNYAQMSEEQLNNLILQLTNIRDGKLGN